MIGPSDILWGLVLPAILAGAIAVASRWCCARCGCGVAAALAVGYAAGHAGIAGWPAVPPNVADGWLVYAAIVGAVVGMIEDAPRRPAALVWALRAVVSFGLPILTLWPIIRYEWPPPLAGAWVIGTGSTIMIMLWSSSEIGQREQGPVLPIAWAMTSGVAGLLCVFGASQKLGQFGGSAAAAWGAVAAVAMFDRKLTLGRGGAVPAVLILAVLLLNAHFYAKLPLWAAALTALAVPAMWAHQLSALQRRGAWPAALIALAAVLAPLLLALIPMAIRFAREMRASFGDYY